ncbi:hypothetical protein TNCV_1624721 [Trichonephila clavipes]|nr:hypothetical protein TNCV_1624721 [Trichonephila clavipes]
MPTSLAVHTSNTNIPGLLTTHWDVITGTWPSHCGRVVETTNSRVSAGLILTSFYGLDYDECSSSCRKQEKEKERVKTTFTNQNILEPIFDETPTSHGKGIDKVELHVDKASSHTSKSSDTYLAKKETGIKCIPF